MPYPKVSIVFCVRCKWNLRSAWYLQELIQTFGADLKEISMVPGEPGIFQIIGYKDEHSEQIILWDRAKEGGFPDSKCLKQRVKAALFNNDISIGAHNEKGSKLDVSNNGLLLSESRAGQDVKGPPKAHSSSCQDCET